MVPCSLPRRPVSHQGGSPAGSRWRRDCRPVGDRGGPDAPAVLARPARAGAARLRWPPGGSPVGYGSTPGGTRPPGAPRSRRPRDHSNPPCARLSADAPAPNRPDLHVSHRGYNGGRDTRARKPSRRSCSRWPVLLGDRRRGHAARDRRGRCVCVEPRSSCPACSSGPLCSRSRSRLRPMCIGRTMLTASVAR